MQRLSEDFGNFLSIIVLPSCFVVCIRLSKVIDMVMIVLFLLTGIIAYIRIVDAGYCSLPYGCVQYSYRIKKYSLSYSRRMCCSGYKGPSCTQAICSGSTSCPNGGTCSSPNTCRCRPGFGGSRCQDINECSMRNGGCNHICKNSIGSYQCDCKNGFYLASDGKTCEDINECSKNNGDCNQNCKNVDGSYKCFCMDGYKLARDGKMCEDINECLDMTCLNNGSCVNVAGSYSCQCSQGFSGDVCQSDIDECLLSNGTCDDQCVNTNGSFICKCNGDSSYVSGDGVSCIVHVNEKSNNSTAVGLGTSISLIFVVVAVLFVAYLKTRHKKLSTPNDTQSTSEIYQSAQIRTSGVRTIYNNLYENVLKPEDLENNRSMNEYESVVVKEVVKVDSKTGGLSPYDNIQIKGIIDDSGQQRPDRETAEYENLVIFRK